MLEVTPLAIQNLKHYLTQKKIESSLRVSFTSGGCSGPSLGLTLDEEKKNDHTHVQEGVTFLIDKDLMELCGGIKIDFIDSGGRSGFSVSSINPVDGGSCGGSCKSRGCGC